MARAGKSQSSSLMVRLDATSKSFLRKAARLRGISVSDYVRAVTVTQARREVHSAEQQVLAMTADEQLAFWTALQEPRPLTRAQKELGKLMQGRP